MKPRIKKCSGCGREKQIFQGWTTRFPLCRDCIPRKERKPIKPGKTKIPQRSGSYDAVQAEDRKIKKRIWEHRSHACEECGIEFPAIGDCDASHLMSKGAHADLRHEEQNIVLHCRPCHQKWEIGDRRSMRTYEKHIHWMQANGYCKE